jgi:hypothetical protein
MRRTLPISLLLLSLTVWGQPAQTPPPPPPQSPRQALLEMFLGTTPNHLEKHLPDIAKKALQQLDMPDGSGFLAQVAMISAQAHAGGSNFQTFETGPILLMNENPQTQEKFEVSVEQDNLIGDENQIDLAFRMYRKGRQETLPFVPRLTFLMKTEAGIWKLDEIALSVRMPLADPDFLKGMVKDLKKKQRNANETTANLSLRAIVSAESRFHTAHPERGYTCSLSELASLAPDQNPENNGMPVDKALAAGTKEGYIYAITGCDGLHYKVAAEPVTSAAGQHALCTDESGEIKFSSDGKATTCLRRGKLMNEADSDNE